MADTPFETTEHLGIGKFHDDQRPGETELNNMRDKIDRISVRFIATRASLPASPSSSNVPRRIFYIEDEKVFTRERDGGYDDIPLVNTDDLSLKENIANKGQPNGYAGLDSDGKVPATQLPAAIMNYRGQWDAATNTPEVADGFGNPGDVYRVSVAGTRDLGHGSVTYAIGDIIICNESQVWEKSSVADAVVSVNGMSGVVTINKSTVGLDQVDNTSDANKPISNAVTAALLSKANDADVVHLAGTETITGGKTFAITPIGPDANPTADNELTRKKYVDDGLTAGLATKANDSAVMHLTGDETATGSKTLETVGIGVAANAKTVLDVTSTTKGSRPFPSMTTTQRNGLVLPPEGLHIYNTTTHQDEVWNGTSWVAVGAVQSVNGETGAVSLDKTDIGLGNVDNTSDADKPVSTAQQTALDAKAVKDFSGLTEKVTLANDDLFIINDSEASGAVKKVKKSNLGGAKPDYVIEIPAGAFFMPSSNGAPLDMDTGTNGTILRHLFDDSTDEFLESIFTVPSDVKTDGTVTIDVIGYPTTAGTDKDVVFDFYYSAKTSGESWDGAYASKSSGAKRCSNTQDVITKHSFTETITNLGWSAGDQVRMKLARDADNASDTLVGDWGLTMLRISIPRS